MALFGSSNGFQLLTGSGTPPPPPPHPFGRLHLQKWCLCVRLLHIICRFSFEPSLATVVCPPEDVGSGFTCNGGVPRPICFVHPSPHPDLTHHPTPPHPFGRLHLQKWCLSVSASPGAPFRPERVSPPPHFSVPGFASASRSSGASSTSATTPRRPGCTRRCSAVPFGRR